MPIEKWLYQAINLILWSNVQMKANVICFES